MKTSEELIKAINDLTPDIKGKAFNPGWFQLREQLEQVDHRIATLEHALGECVKLIKMAHWVEWHGERIAHAEIVNVSLEEIQQTLTLANKALKGENP